MSTATIDMNEHRCQQVWSWDELTAFGTRARGWTVTDMAGNVLAQYREPELGAAGAIDRYRQQRTDAEPEQCNE